MFKQNKKSTNLIDICYSKSSRISQNTLNEKNGKYSIFGADGEIKKIDTYDIETSYIAMIKDGASAGKFFLLPPKSSVIGTLVYIINKDNCDLRYLYYLLCDQDLNKYKIGSTIPHIYFNDLIYIDVQIATYEEQQKIGSFFSAIDELIVKQNQKLSSLNEYYKYLLNSIFINRLGLKNNHNFVENALSKISVVKDGTHSSPTYVNDGYPLITSKNLMKNGKIEFKDLNYIAEHDFNEINKRSKVDKGDILFGMIGTLGNPVICENDNFAIKNVALIKAKPPLNSYLVHYLKSKLVLDQFDFLKTGGTQKFIALNKIRELKILLPNLEAQKKIGTFLNKIEELILKQEKVLNIYNLIKKYYLSEIFSKGE